MPAKTKAVPCVAGRPETASTIQFQPNRFLLKTQRLIRRTIKRVVPPSCFGACAQAPLSIG